MAHFDLLKAGARCPRTVGAGQALFEELNANLAALRLARAAWVFGR
jgi:hypothetical protein